MISKTSKTSPVFDRLYNKYAHIFIFTPEGKMTYSGTGAVVKALKEKYEEKKLDNPSLQYWLGGDLPDYGFFGTDSPLNKNEIKEV